MDLEAAAGVAEKLRLHARTQSSGYGQLRVHAVGPHMKGGVKSARSSRTTRCIAPDMPDCERTSNVLAA
jgi:hypothetical protein